MKKINEKISKLLESKDLYGFMVTDPYNMHYISGFAGEGVLLITGDRKLLITDGRYTKWAKETLDLNEWDIRIQESGERRSIVISGEIKEASLSKDFKVSKDLRVGYEDQNLSVFDFAAIKKELPDFTREAHKFYLRFIKIKANPRSPMLIALQPPPPPELPLSPEEVLLLPVPPSPE